MEYFQHGENKVIAFQNPRPVDFVFVSVYYISNNSLIPNSCIIPGQF
jgi:hypothetical protein